ncbi:MAG: IcmT/TraK family protein [Alphaproteobacteria bacterium]
MDTHWRNTQKPARFFMFDARSSASVFLFLIHARAWTFSIVIITLLFFWVMERRGLTFESALRTIRIWFLGRRRPATLHGRRRHWVDFG